MRIVNISNSTTVATGDDLRTAFAKLNLNFVELYGVIAPAGDMAAAANAVLTIAPGGSAFASNVAVDGGLVIMGSVTAIADGGDF